MALSASSSRYDIEKFNGNNDFALWKIKMQSLLGNLGLKEALKEESTEKVGEGVKILSMEQKVDIEEKAYNTLILSLGDKVLQEVSKMTATLEIWKKLDSLYFTKTLSSQLFLKARFFTFRMKDNQKLQDHIDEFNKLCLDLENINVKYDDEDKALVLLHSLPQTYEHFVDILHHGREKLALDDVIGALKFYRLKI